MRRGQGVGEGVPRKRKEFVVSVRVLLTSHSDAVSVHEASMVSSSQVVVDRDWAITLALRSLWY
jgi:hypothetical protein